MQLNSAETWSWQTRIPLNLEGWREISSSFFSSFLSEWHSDLVFLIGCTGGVTLSFTAPLAHCSWELLLSSALFRVVNYYLVLDGHSNHSDNVSRSPSLEYEWHSDLGFREESTVGNTPAPIFSFVEVLALLLITVSSFSIHWLFWCF